MADVFDVLRRDHDQVKRILTELEQGPTMVSGADDRQIRRRKDLAARLVMESSKHEALEEEYFWPAFRAEAADGERLADTAVGQETAAKRLLHALETANPNHESFEKLLEEVTADTRDHVAFEEQQAWPALRSVISGERANELADRIEAGRGGAPTRPHPATPPRPKVLKTAGAAAAALDRVRDKITHRGGR